MIDTITAAMAAYEIAVGPTPEYQTAWRSWAVGVYEFVAGGDTACDLLKGTLFGEPYPSPAAIGSASWCESPRLPWSVVTTYDWCTTTGTLRAGGSSSCEDTCSICGGPNTAAFEGGGWCDGCDQDARLDGDGGEG